MKWRKSCGQVGLSLLLVWCLLTGASAGSDEAAPAVSWEAMEAQYQAIVALEEVAYDQCDYIDTLWSEADFGGYYLDDEHVLTVMLTDPSDAVLLEGRPVRVRSCAYSLAQLKHWQQEQRAYSDALDLQSVTLRIQDNRLYLSVGPAVPPEQAEAVVASAPLCDWPLTLAYEGDAWYVSPQAIDPPDAADSAAAQGESALQPLSTLPDDYAVPMATFIGSNKGFGTLGFFAMEKSGGYRLGFVTADT